MALREHTCEVIFVACRNPVQCRDATEAELLAVEEGLKLALHWATLPFTVETDCAEVIELIKDSTPNTSVYAFRIAAIHALLKERSTGIVKISRYANQASHELAKLSRVQHRTAVWLRNFPEEITDAINNDCNPIAV
uniref:Uncharacterized protein n=1 Tax=Avena sativa TaxID=4498 RepID=A0ACD5WDU7_AVESA